LEVLRSLRGIGARELEADEEEFNVSAGLSEFGKIVLQHLAESTRVLLGDSLKADEIVGLS
jgi:hypothetical protein